MNGAHRLRLYVQDPTGYIVPEIYHEFITKFITFITVYYHENYHAVARARSVVVVCRREGLLCDRMCPGRVRVAPSARRAAAAADMPRYQPLSSRGTRTDSYQMYT